MKGTETQIDMLKLMDRNSAKRNNRAQSWSLQQNRNFENEKIDIRKKQKERSILDELIGKMQ